MPPGIFSAAAFFLRKDYNNMNSRKVNKNRNRIMRSIFVLTAALFLLSASGTLHAQIHININFNLDSQPAWGPVGYDYVDYYYLPAIDIYYSVPLHRYYYEYRGRWISSIYLPARYRDFDLYTSYKVVVNEREPWRNDRVYRERYYSDRDRHDQEIIRDSRDPKYFANKYHPEHKKWLEEQRHDRGNHKGWDKGRGDYSRHGDKKDRGGHGHGDNGGGHERH